MPPLFFSGLDLGQAADYTALAVLERTKRPDPADPGKMVSHFAARHLQRFPLGTSYAVIASRLSKMFAKEPLPETVLAIDQTGVGRSVIDFLRQANIDAKLWPITITSGSGATMAEDGFRVAKKELISALQIALQERRLKIAPSLPEAQVLLKELSTYQVKLTESANETFSARSGAHDDLVLSAAMACWVGDGFEPMSPPQWIGEPRQRNLNERLRHCSRRGLFPRT